MKPHFQMRAALAALLLCVFSLPGPAVAAAPPATPAPLTILFTHDTHDHFYPDAGDVGGYTRLATLLKEQRQAARQDTAYGENGRAVVTLDAGDFSMGSLFQTVYTTDAPELRALGAMGYDVTTLGNHEFDYRQQGLADMLTAAMGAENYVVENGVSRQVPAALPAIVQANYTTPADPDSPEAQALVKAMESYPVTPYTLLERNGLKIAVFGLMGLDSHECAPMSGMVYEPIVDAAQRTVAEIQDQESPDYIICLSHSGTENGKGEDYELAKAVDGIDVIISGHTHTTLPEPIRVGDTLIVSCGPYTQNLGVLTVDRGGQDGAVQFRSYQLLPIDGSVPRDEEMAALADGFKGQVDEKYLSQFGLSYDQAIAASGRDFSTAETGDLIGEAYISTVKGLEGDSYVPIAFAVAPNGVIRDQIRAGDVTTSHAFDILSLGSGADGSPGYPLVSIYLTGKDLKNAFELDASISPFLPVAQLHGAGSRWTYNPHRMLLDRVTDCAVTTPEITGAIDDGKLYRVVADLYSGQMLGAVERQSFHLLSITPRDENGNKVTDLESRILHDANGREVKAWYALASYLKDRGTVSPPGPSKQAQPSWNPVRLLFPMGVPTALTLAVGTLLLAVILFVIRRLAAPKRRRGGTNGYRPYRG